MPDLRLAVRQLLRSPLQSLLAVAILALGIGAGTAVFSAFNALYLRPLAFPRSDELVRVWSAFPERGLDQTAFSWSRFAAIRGHQTSFRQIAAEANHGLVLTGRGDATGFGALAVSDGFFDVLGWRPALGRGFLPAEDVAGGPAVVVLSDRLWRERFGADPRVLGTAVTLNGRPHEVVGVMPARAPFPYQEVDLYVPRVFEIPGMTPQAVERGSGFVALTGRLRPGVEPRQAEAELQALARAYAEQDPTRVDAKAGILVRPMQEDLVDASERLVLLVLGAVALLLVVAAVNVSNLLLVRFAARRREIAVRLALGGSRWRIVRLFLAEALVLALVAGAVGVFAAWLSVDLLATFAGRFLPRGGELSLDPTVLLVALGATLFTALLLGVLPAWQGAAQVPADALKSGGGHGSTTGPAQRRFRAGLLVAEVALAVVLLCGAGLLGRSFLALARADLGVRPEGVVVFGLGLTEAAYLGDDAKLAFADRLLASLRALPGVDAAAFNSGVPMLPSYPRTPVAAAGADLKPIEQRPLVYRAVAGPGWLQVAGVPLLRGRDFTDRDDASAPAVALVSESLARMLFGDADPIGRKLLTGIAAIEREIVGVVGDVKVEGAALPAMPQVYVSSRQLAQPGGFFYLRSTRPASALAPEVRAAVRALDPNLVVGDLSALEEIAAGSYRERTAALGVVGAFAATALLLSALGLYGVMAATVAQRTTEIGVRLALGAPPDRIRGMVLGEGSRLAALGLAVGLAGAVAGGRLVSSLLYEVPAWDPPTLLAVATVIALVAFLACWLPARRATRVDPCVALRGE